MFNEAHPGGAFENELAWHLTNGIVNITREVGILAYHANSETFERNGYEVLPVDKCDSWYCTYAAGSMDAICRYIQGLEPRMKYVIFERGGKHNKTRKILTERFLQYGQKQRKST